MPKKNITIEQLAQMVKRGFDGTHGELNGLRGELGGLRDEIDGLREGLNDFRKDAIEEFNRIHADIKDIKVALGPLVRVVAAQDSEIQRLRTRMDRVERKVGLTS